MTGMFIAAAATIVIEAALLALLGYRSWRVVAAIVLVNLASNLSMNLALAFVPEWARTPALAILEGLVVLVEWLVLLRFTDRARARVLSDVTIANAASLAVGLIAIRTL